MTPEQVLEQALGLEDEPATPNSLDALTIARVRRRLDLLLDDGSPPEPSPGLAALTIELVESQRRMSEASRPKRWGDLLPTTVPFRWADVAVAASLFIAGTLALIPANHRSMMQASQLTCLSNLQQLGTGLNRYAATHESYPYPDIELPIALNGVYVAILNDEHLLDPETAKALHCPCAAKHEGSHPATLPHMSELVDLHRESPEKCRKAVSSDYAYHRGVQTAQGRPEPVPARLLGAVVPLLSDQPRHDEKGRILAGNSPNHGGGGQNVLFTDGHAAWRRLRWISDQDRDIFLNQHGLAAPGVNNLDSALGPAVFPVISR